MSVIIKETVTYGLKVILSTKNEIQIDPDEVAAVIEAISTGGIARVRQGIINPSYVVAVVEDVARKKYFLEDTRHDKEKRDKGMRSLENIFSDQKLLGKPKQNDKNIQSDSTSR